MRFDNFVKEFTKYFKLENTPHLEEMRALEKFNPKRDVNFKVLSIKGFI